MSKLEPVSIPSMEKLCEEPPEMVEAPRRSSPHVVEVELEHYRYITVELPTLFTVKVAPKTPF